MSAGSGSLIIVAAPSGAGKTSLVARLLAATDGLLLSTSYTTRRPRPGEVDGEHYHFVTPEAFQKLITTNALLEWALVHGHHYGTGTERVTSRLARGEDVLLEIDWQGARQVKQRLPHAQSIFILPPSRQALLERLTARRQDSPEVIATRLANAREEILHAEEFDYWIVNDDFETALTQLEQVVAAIRLRARVQRARHARLLASLLQDDGAAAPP